MTDGPGASLQHLVVKHEVSVSIDGPPFKLGVLGRRLVVVNVTDNALTHGRPIYKDSLRLIARIEKEPRVLYVHGGARVFALAFGLLLVEIEQQRTSGRAESGKVNWTGGSKGHDIEGSRCRGVG